MSLRQRLAQRQRPSVTFRLRIEDDTSAQAELAAAQASGDADRITSAQDTVNACYEPLIITALPPAEWEALIEQHPPTEEQKKQGNSWFNPVTFYPALLAACVDGDETEDEWMEYTTKGPLSLGEANALIDAVTSVNQRGPEPWVTPKG